MTLSARKITAFTKLVAALADHPSLGTTALLKQWFDSSPEELRVSLNGLIDDLSSEVDGASGADAISATAITGLTGTTLQPLIESLKALVDANENRITNNRLLSTTGNFTGTLMGQPIGLADPGISAALAAHLVENAQEFASIERNQANLVAIAEINAQSIPSSGYAYDLYRGSSLNLYSTGILDVFASNVSGALSAGATSATLLSVTGLAIGREVTFQDIVTEATRERVVITNIVGNVISFAAITNAYAAQARVYRSLGSIDTVNHRLKFGGASYQDFVTNTAVNVVASAYDTSGNGGRKIVKLSNGWLIAIESNSTTLQIQKSVDSGATWTALCNITGMQIGSAISSIGTKVTVICNSTTVVYSVTFDATTVTNIDLNSTKVTIDTQTSLSNNMTVCADLLGYLHAAFSTKNATYANSFNIRYSKSTDGGVTWAAVTQLSTDNTAGIDSTNPCIIVKANNNPEVFWQYVTGGSYYIKFNLYNGSAWGGLTTLYNGSTYAQSNPCASVAPSGRIWVVWHGFDATDTAIFNIRYSYSDDGGVTWLAAVKLTSGNTYAQGYPSVSIDKNNNVYVLWYGKDATTTTIFNIYRNIWTGTAFQGVTKLTTNTTVNANNPSAIDNNTLDFNLLTPPMIYQDQQAVAVKYSGTLIATTTLLLKQEDFRYNITPIAGTSDEVRAWVQYDDFTGFTLSSALSIVDTAANESFVAMTPITTDLGTTKEDYYDGSVATLQEKVTQRLTMVRASTSDDKAITKYLASIL